MRNQLEDVSATGFFGQNGHDPSMVFNTNSRQSQ
jgi:hypothetical protein